MNVKKMSPEEIERKKIGERINRIREARGGTIATDAANMVMAASSLSDILNGKRELRSDTIRKICNYYGVSADYILGLSDVITPDEATRNIHTETGFSDEVIPELCNLSKIEIRYISDLLRNKKGLSAISYSYGQYISISRLINKEGGISGNIHYEKPNGVKIKVPADEIAQYLKMDFIHEVLSFLDKSSKED